MSRAAAAETPRRASIPPEMVVFSSDPEVVAVGRFLER
jgi:hypothetical protein